MLFKKTKLPGSYLIELERHVDARGFFARSFCEKEFTAQGLTPRLVQCNISYNAKRGTLRGMHYQIKPFEEAKLVRCTRGAIYDVIADLRPDSSTYCQWAGFELSSSRSSVEYKMLYIPAGFAHGFITLEDDTEVFYQMSEFYSPEHARGVRWNDPAFGIEWPLEPTLVSERDRLYEDFSPGKGK